MSKIDVNKVIEECTTLQNQIDGLSILLKQRKNILAGYFETTGVKNASGEDSIAYVVERINTEYDVDKLQNKLPKEICEKFINKQYSVVDWVNFVKFMKEKGVSGQEIKKYFIVNTDVDEKKLSDLYEHGEIDVSDLEGCYTSTVTKSIAIRSKHKDKTIPLKE